MLHKLLFTGLVIFCSAQIHGMDPAQNSFKCDPENLPKYYADMLTLKAVCAAAKLQIITVKEQNPTLPLDCKPKNPLESKYTRGELAQLAHAHTIPTAWQEN